MPAEPVDRSASGRCLCGHYRFHTRGNPLWVAYCHCKSCRRFNAAPVAPYVGFPADAVNFEPQAPPTIASSPEVRRSFCERCGTALAYAADWFPGEIHLFRSSFQRPEDFQLTRHVLFNERETDFDIWDDLPRYGTEPGRVIAWGPRPAFRVLFLCTGNSARSILGESILNLKNATLDERRIRGHSAGSTPTGVVNPGALALLAPYVHQLDHLRSKSWDEFTEPGAPPLEWVITLCDSAAAEVCPVMPGPARKRHWSLPDPASGSVSFEATWEALEARIDGFLEELGA